MTSPKSSKRGPRGGIYDPFPVKFHRMLDQIRDEGQESVVSWLAHGRAFKIHKPKVFAASIMPRFFNQSKYTSFQRQLNLYGFNRCCRGRDCGAYHHPYFLHGRIALAKNIVRTKIKGNGHKTIRLHGEAEPDFYTMAPLHEYGQECASITDGSSVGSLERGSSFVSATNSFEKPTMAAPMAAVSALPGPTSLLPALSLDVTDVTAKHECPSPDSPISLSMNELRRRSSLISEVSGGTGDFVNDLNESIFIHELAMGCTILCQLRKDTTL